jgi:hypothetical protein
MQDGSGRSMSAEEQEDLISAIIEEVTRSEILSLHKLTYILTDAHRHTSNTIIHAPVR